MATPGRDWFRLALLFPLLLIAALGRGGLRVDVENLAMKSVGTQTDEVATLRAREFGNRPRVLLVASPRAPEVLSPIDDEEISVWIDGVRGRPEVVELESAGSPNPGERCLGVTLLTDAEGRYAAAAESLAEFARHTLPPTFELAIAGVPQVEIAIAREMSAERSRILPIIAISLALVLLALYRNPVHVLGVLLAPLTGVFLLEGIQGWLDLPVDPVSALLGPAVLTVGVASSVHVLERYRRELARDVSPEAASAEAARHLRFPLLLTVVTTLAGFLGLLASPIPAVQRFGVLASVGVVLAVATTLLCLPSLLRRFPGSRHRDRRHLPFPHRSRLRSLMRVAPLVTGASLVATLAGALFMGGLRVDSDPLHVLSANDTARADAETIARRLGGSEVFDLLLPPDGPGGLFAKTALIGRVVALDGVVAPAGKPRRSEGGYSLLTFLLAPGGSAGREATFAAAERLARDAGWEGAHATGLSVRMARDSNALVSGQRRGLLATVAALFLVMALGFRSIGLGLLGLVPNVLPIVLIQGALGALDRPLTVASSMIGSVMLGLVVDDTIHLLDAYRTAPGQAVRRVQRSLELVTRPIVLTTTALCVGFSATLFGELNATREFGLLAVATLLIALLADLFLLPALLLGRRPTSPALSAEPSPCLESLPPTS